MVAGGTGGANNQMKEVGACEDCKNNRPNNLTPIGSPVRHGARLGSASSVTEYNFGQCEKCGSIWVHIEDRGADGRGKFDQRLTKNLF